MPSPMMWLPSMKGRLTIVAYALFLTACHRPIQPEEFEAWLKRLNCVPQGVSASNLLHEVRMTGGQSYFELTGMTSSAWSEVEHESSLMSPEDPNYGSVLFFLNRIGAPVQEGDFDVYWRELEFNDVVYIRYKDHRALMIIYEY